MSTDDQLLVQRQEEEHEHPVASTSQLTASAVTRTATRTEAAEGNDDGTQNARTTKYYGLAVTMDGLEEEPNTVDGQMEEDDVDHEMDLGQTTAAAGGSSSNRSSKRPSQEVVEAEAAQDLESRRQSQLRKQNRFTKASVLIPPENFAIVEDGLYRSAQPTELNFPFLQRLGLRSLIWLAPEEPQLPFLEFLTQESIQVHRLGILHPEAAWDAITEDVVLKALDIILTPASYPLVVMCNQGRHRTGTVIGCLRKLQRWNLASIFEEYRRHAGAKVRVLNEQFIELFDTDLVHIPVPPATSDGSASASASE